MPKSLVISAALALLVLAPLGVNANEHCAEGKTISPGVLTVATGNPAYFPWVIDDNPESGEGFEAAVAYAIAEEMGFGRDAVVWVRTGFDESIQPGEKNFDFNLQQFSITEEREKMIDFSMPYYSAAMAVLTSQPVVDAGATPDMDSIRGLKWGAVASTTAVPMLNEFIMPSDQPLLYNDNADVVEAMKANQIDAALFDLPTALFIAAVMLDNGVILGQFPAERADNPDNFGLLMQEDSPLRECVNAAISALSASGSLAEIESVWLSETTGVPVINS